jgi:hypothetical protein
MLCGNCEFDYQKQLRRRICNCAESWDPQIWRKSCSNQHRTTISPITEKPIWGQKTGEFTMTLQLRHATGFLHLVFSAAISEASARTIADDGSSGQVPIIANSYIDNRFGTWMFQTSGPHTCYSDGRGNGCSTPCGNLRCNPPCKVVPGTASASGQTVCPAVAGLNGDWAPNARASVRCGDTIIINGFGFTDVSKVQFQSGNNYQIYVSPRMSILSDDVISTTLNAPGDAVYTVAVQQSGSWAPVVVGELSVTGRCSAGP